MQILDSSLEETTPDDVSSVEPLTAQTLGALLSQKVRRIDKSCLECHKVMGGVTIRREFCSPKCRQKNWMRRLKNLRPGEPMVYVARGRRDPAYTEALDQ